jgi:sec-independent protein translocase protein TatA
MSWIHWLLLAGVALILFGGRGKVSDLMGDFGKGINSFKKGLSESKDDPKVINAEDTKKDKTTV